VYVAAGRRPCQAPTRGAPRVPPRRHRGARTGRRGPPARKSGKIEGFDSPPRFGAPGLAVADGTKNGTVAASALVGGGAWTADLDGAPIEARITGRLMKRNGRLGGTVSLERLDKDASLPLTPEDRALAASIVAARRSRYSPTVPLRTLLLAVGHPRIHDADGAVTVERGELRLRVVPGGDEGIALRPGCEPAHVLVSGARGPRSVQRDLAAERARAERLLVGCPLLAALPMEGDDRIASDVEACLELLLELEAQRGDGLVVEWPAGDPLRAPIRRDTSSLRVRVGADAQWLAFEADAPRDRGVGGRGRPRSRRRSARAPGLARARARRDAARASRPPS
jgi:hypothetical protein